MFRRLVLFIVLGLSFYGFGQKYNFVNLNVEDGLIQSQVSYICQDNYRQLWIGTEGGICKFDGKKFTGYSVQEGLVANHINLIHCDRAGTLWVGTGRGISLFNGRNFKNIFPCPGPINNVSAFTELDNGNMLAICNFKAFAIINFKPRPLCISGDTAEKITAISDNTNGSVLVYIYGKGLYSYFPGKKSKRIYETGKNRLQNSVTQIKITKAKDTLLLIKGVLYGLKRNSIIPFSTLFETLSLTNVLCVDEDGKNKLWIGTESGAYKFDGKRLIHFGGRSGLTDNSVNKIFLDAENNLWFATDADGIFKFRENTFTYFDKSSGLFSSIVTGIAETSKGTIYVGCYGGGLYRINNKQNPEPVQHNGPVLVNNKVYCLITDRQDNIWVGTVNNGVWKYNEKKGLQNTGAIDKYNTRLSGAVSLFEYNNHEVIIGSRQGLFITNKNNLMTPIKIPNKGVVTCVVRINEDSMLVGTSKGLFFIDRHYKVSATNIMDSGNVYVLCLAKQNSNIWIGTTDKGVLNWNYRSGKMIRYTTANGLPSNFIYSILNGGNQKTWVGTGFGISGLQVNQQQQLTAVKNYGRADGLLGMECSHNCLIQAADSSIWFGTTKGLFQFNPYTYNSEKTAPLIFLKSVKLFSSEITDSSLFEYNETWFNVPQGLKLRPKQNHVTFELGSIYFTNPEDIVYKYKLIGIDNGFTTSNNPVIIYPSLPPGKYTLMVSAITKNGTIVSNQLKYRFEIEEAFYQTSLFKVVMVVLLLATGGLIAYIINRGRQKRRQKAKETLEKIREEEFMKLRQRTAEDFHDEMGNNLTRISVLTDMLKLKIDPVNKEVNNLVQQIKNNTTSLYNGSKDIIWSLNSQNDGLYEITEHIKDIGIELFSELPVDFNYAHNVSQGNPLKLKLDHSRHLTMIFKEAYNNIVKYSGASLVNVNIELSPGNELIINLQDNGIGFNKMQINAGNGLRNIENRIKRMNGLIEIITAHGHGTQIQIKLNTIFI